MSFSLTGDGWIVREAVPEDNAGICDLFRSVHLKSNLDLAQERDPDFFALPRLHLGDFRSYVGVADGQIVACGTIVLRDGWLAGRRISTGYLCDLRIAPGFRGGLHLARAYGDVINHVRETRGTELFTTVIFDSNRQAREALTRRSEKRRHQPVYREMTPFRMISVQFTTKKAAPERPIRPATPADLPALVAFLDAQARTRDLGEPFDQGLLERRLAAWPDFALDAFLLAHDGEELVGCVAPWDTGSFKRTRVLGYHGSMKAVQWGFNAFARLARFPPLPPAGDCFRFAFLSHLEVRNDDAGILRDLLRAAYARHRQSGWHFLSAFVPRDSPLEDAFGEFRVTNTGMTLYAVHPEDSPHAGREVRTTRPGFEMALS